MMAAGRATLRCGLFSLFWLGAGGVLSGSVLVQVPVMGERLNWRHWKAGPSLVG